jgi:5-methylthioadenosine/S-adenosylhomocysteine deaminase
MKILIKNVSIITQNKKREYIPVGFIVIKNDKLEKIVDGNPEEKDTKGVDKIINARKMVVMPGFINAHVHLGESVFADFFSGQYSLEYYLEMTNKLTKKTDLIENERGVIADYSLLNLIKKGTTTICGGRTTDQSEYWGMRNLSGYMLMNSFKLKEFSTDVEKKFKKEYEKIKRTRLSYPSLFVHSLDVVTPGLIKIIKNILHEYPDVRLVLHVAETKKHEQGIFAKFGVSSINFLYKNGLLNNRTILVHGNWINSGDMKIVKKCNASIVHCLSSNINVADKILNLKMAIKNGIRTCIATDGVVTSGTFSVLDEAARCYVYYKCSKNKNNNLFSFQKILDMITIDAAEVLGLESIIGSIEEGKRADLVFVEKGKTQISALENIIKEKQKICCVMLDGKLKMWNNKMLTMDECGVMNRFRTLTKKIKKEV